MPELSQSADYDIRVKQGAEWRERWQWTTEQDDGTLLPNLLNGYTLSGQIRTQRARNSPLIATFAFEQTVGMDDGEFDIVLPADVTDTIVIDGWFDVFITPDADPTAAELFLQGRMRVDLAVTV